MTWHAHIAVRCNGKLNATHWDQIKKWPEVKRVWSTMGDWDFWMEANDKIANTEDLEKFVFKLRKEGWVDGSSAHWWKEI